MLGGNKGTTLYLLLVVFLLTELMKLKFLFVHVSPIKSTAPIALNFKKNTSWEIR